MDTKSCSRCGETKPLDEFYRKEGRPSSWCKVCTLADIKRRYRSKHPEPPPYQPPTEKACKKCGETKPIEQYHRRRSARDGRQTICATCATAIAAAFNKSHPDYHRQHAKAWGRANPERKADIALKTRLGIPYGTYDRMFAEQEGKCAICKTDSPGARTKRFHVDHDNDTGVIRGLLCSRCNTGIGQLRHSETLLLAAIAYLASNTK
jgi:hypothetical protein